MKSIFLAVVLSLAALSTAQANDDLAKDVVVYKNPQCGCCNKWVRYLEGHGYNVSVENTRDIYAVKQRLGIPERLAACHTAIIDGYIVEGHITHRDIERLLLTQPEVKGIAVPGMPAGTPGMEMGNVVESYDVISFDENGKLKIFTRH